MVDALRAIISRIGYCMAYYYITLNVYILDILTRSKGQTRGKA